MTTTTNTIEIGRRVYCILYGGRRGTIVSITGTPGQVPVRNMLGVVMTGGSSEVSIVWDNGSRSDRVFECTLWGVQWKILDEVVSSEAVAQAITNAALYDAQMKVKAENTASIFRQAMAKAEAEGQAMGLISEAEFRRSGRRGTSAAYNLRWELKRAGIMSRVCQNGYNCLNVKIKRAEDKDRAWSIAGKYKAGRFDGMTDSYEYDPSAWGKVFGDVEYLFIDIDRRG